MTADVTVRETVHETVEGAQVARLAVKADALTAEAKAAMARASMETGVDAVRGAGVAAVAAVVDRKSVV